jgi:hypothetical protein
VEEELHSSSSFLVVEEEQAAQDLQVVQILPPEPYDDRNWVQAEEVAEEAVGFGAAGMVDQVGLVDPFPWASGWNCGIRCLEPWVDVAEGVAEVAVVAEAAEVVGQEVEARHQEVEGG